MNPRATDRRTFITDPPAVFRNRLGFTTTSPWTLTRGGTFTAAIPARAGLLPCGRVRLLFDWDQVRVSTASRPTSPASARVVGNQPAVTYRFRPDASASAGAFRRPWCPLIRGTP